MALAIFDLDGTLVDQKAAALAWARGCSDKWGLDASATEVIATALEERRSKGEIFSDVVRRFQLGLDPAELWDDYRAQMPHLVRCTDADRSALKELREAGWTLGIVTNGMVDNQVGKISNTGLAELVDGWVVSAEVNSRKPDPAIFHELARRLGCPLEGWMIGDSLEADIAGGLGVGLNTAWISSESSLKYETTPTVTAHSVAEAVPLILNRRCR